KTRGGAAGNDHVTQLVRVLFRVGLPGAHLLALFKEPSDPEKQLAFSRMLIGRTRIGWQIQPDNTDTTGRTHRIHQLVQYDGGLFLTSRGGCLISDRIDSAVDPVGAHRIGDLFCRLSTGEVDRFGAYMGSQIEARLHLVDDEDPAGALDNR